MSDQDSVERRKLYQRNYARRKYQALSKVERRARHSSPVYKRAKEKYRSKPENRRKEYEGHKKWLARDNNAQKKQARRRLRTYGLTEEHYQTILNKQMGLCAICHRPPKPQTKFNSPDNFVIDHCHTTNKVRGLLCGGCNKAIGLLEDTPEYCVSAAMYLKENS